MTIAIVANSTWNLHNFRRGLTEALVTAGYRVVLLAPDGPERKQLQASGAQFIGLRHLQRSGMNPVRDLALLRELWRIYRREQITHALHFTIKPVIYGSLAARWAGVANISTLTGLGYTFLAGKQTNWVVRLLYRLALRKAGLVLFHNPDDRKLFLAGNLCRAEQTGLVGGSGIRMTDFPQSPLTEAKPGRFLFAGRLLADKGIREYVAAAKLARAVNPDLRFHVLGAIDHGNPAAISEGELEEWIAAGYIIYDGVTEDIRPHLRRAYGVVLPSYREGCPRVLLEAAATGRPVIGTNVPGVKEVVHHDLNGKLVPVKSGQALADAVLEIYGGPGESVAAMGEWGRKLVSERFSEAKVVAVYLRGIKQLANQRKLDL